MKSKTTTQQIEILQRLGREIRLDQNEPLKPGEDRSTFYYLSRREDRLALTSKRYITEKVLVKIREVLEGGTMEKVRLLERERRDLDVCLGLQRIHGVGVKTSIELLRTGRRLGAFADVEGLRDLLRDGHGGVDGETCVVLCAAAPLRCQAWRPHPPLDARDPPLSALRARSPGALP